MVPERGNSGAVEYVLVISRDITQHKLTETALHEAETLAAAAQITATLAHEINNPLAAAVNAIYLLGRNPSLDRDAQELVNVVSSSLERITNISRRMLFLYKREGDAIG
jgi:signal transduction histidine kinase